MELDLQALAGTTKTVFTNFRTKAFPFMNPLTAAAKRGGRTVRFQGEDLVFNAKLGRRGGTVASVIGAIPEHKTAREKKGRLTISRMYQRIVLDGLADRATTDPKGAFLSAFRKAMEDSVDDWRIEQERVLNGDTLAIRGVVSARNSATSIDVISQPP